MKRLAALAVLALTAAAPALAQISDDEAKTFVDRYVRLFNTGDANGLSKEIYALPNVSAADMTTKLAARFDSLREEEFGKMILFGFTTCKDGAATAKIEMRYALQYTYGGNMPPGDLATEFSLSKDDKGWRVVGVVELPAGSKMVCAL